MKVQPTYKLCVVGNPIAHSKSPFIHAEFAKQLAIAISYEKRLIPIQDFVQQIQQLKADGYHGVNITLPFKEKAYALADQHSLAAIRAKAANTFLFKTDGQIYADNTDGIGLITDITQNLNYSLSDKSILICGAGGAVRGILQPIIATKPKSLTIANRTLGKAQLLTDEFQDLMPIHSRDYDSLAGQTFDVVIDGTAFANDPLPLPASLSLSRNSLCYDLKYQDTDTHFMCWAKQHGATLVSNGIGMLVEQAASAFFLWTGQKPDSMSVIQTLSCTSFHMRGRDHCSRI